MKRLFKSVFGYEPPRGKCKKSDFHGNYHRIAWFPIQYDGNGLPGYLVRQRCVTCGKFLGRMWFKPSKRIKLDDKQISDYKNRSC